MEKMSEERSSKNRMLYYFLAVFLIIILSIISLQSLNLRVKEHQVEYYEETVLLMCEIIKVQEEILLIYDPNISIGELKDCESYLYYGEFE